MNSVFQVKDDTPNVYIGLCICRQCATRTLFVDQQLYVNMQLAKYGFLDANPINIPADPNLILSWHMDPETDKINIFPFQEAIGSLNFAQTETCPDISYALSVVGQFTQKPESSHCAAVRKVFQYLKDTADLGICYSQNPNPHQPVVYCDADVTVDPSDWKSHTSYIIFLNGGPVMWGSQKQSITTTSTTEAEYVAAWAATRQIIWLCDLLTEIGYPPAVATTLNSNNQSCIRLIHSPEVHKRTKHVDIRYHATKDAQASEIINATYILSAQQSMDPLTKPLPYPQFSTLCSSLIWSLL
jgi:hypothetical protein